MQIKFLIFYLLLAIGCFQSCSETTDDNIDSDKEMITTEPVSKKKWVTICNERFEFCLEYPATLLNVQIGNSNGDGLELRSSDKKFILEAWAYNNVVGEDINSLYQSVLSIDTIGNIKKKSYNESSFSYTGQISNGMSLSEKVLVDSSAVKTCRVLYTTQSEATYKDDIERILNSFQTVRASPL